jgi:hypothetical protein
MSAKRNVTVPVGRAETAGPGSGWVAMRARFVFSGVPLRRAYPGNARWARLGAHAGGTGVCYIRAMRNTSLALPLALAAAFAAGAQSPAAGAASFAAFPVYPHVTTISAGNASVPGYVVESRDSMSTIDRWYRSKLPAACRRSVLTSGAQTAIEYICSTPRSMVDIVPDGGKIVIHAQPL